MSVQLGLICISIIKDYVSVFQAEGGPATMYENPIVLAQYASITLPFQIVFDGGWSSMGLYIEKRLMIPYGFPEGAQEY